MWGDFTGYLMPSENRSREGLLSGEHSRDPEQQYLSEPDDDINDGPDNRNLEDESQRPPRSFWRALIHGPANPKEPHVTAVWPSVQRFPLELKKRIPLHIRTAIMISGLALWAFLVLILAKRSVIADVDINGDPEVAFLRCGRNHAIWRGADALCGTNGTRCLTKPGQELKFKCPAHCFQDSWTYVPMSVGSHLSLHETFLVGGNNSYRADSFPCAAALHRGIISNAWGGGGIIRYTGPKTSFVGEEGEHGMKSLGFDSYFPDSFEFVDPSDVELHNVWDYRSPIMLISFVAIVLFGYFVTSAGTFFIIVETIGFWTIILGANPPYSGGNTEANAEVISIGFRRFLPCILGSYAIWELCSNPQLEGMQAYLSRAVFWCIPFFCGICENYVFGAIPVDRLTVSDLNDQPGAWLSVVVIFLVIFAIAVGQSYVIWRKGELWVYLRGYILGISGLVILGMIPNQTLRIHHYILALVLLPGTGFQTTPSLVYQGLLFGLYVAGIARWDFDSILQTYVQLARGGPLLNVTPPKLLDPDIAKSTVEGLHNVIVHWNSLEELHIDSVLTNWDGFSLLINDLEYYRGNATSFNLTSWVMETIPAPFPENYYLRVGLASLDKKVTGSFTLAGLVNIATGTWTAPLPGRS